MIIHLGGLWLYIIATVLFYISFTYVYFEPEDITINRISIQVWTLAMWMNFAS